MLHCLLTEFNQEVGVSLESLVEVTFPKHQDIFFLSDLSPAGYSQCADEQKLQHSCRRVFFLTERRALQTRSVTVKLVNFFWFLSFFLFEVGRVAGVLCLPLLTWHCTQKPEGSAVVRMRIYQAESSSC